MPKDPTRNQPNYKIGGYHINEYDYQQNKEQITEEEQLPRPKQSSEETDFQQENAGDSENTDISQETDKQSNAKSTS